MKGREKNTRWLSKHLNWAKLHHKKRKHKRRRFKHRHKPREFRKYKHKFDERNGKFKLKVKNVNKLRHHGIKNTMFRGQTKSKKQKGKQRKFGRKRKSKAKKTKAKKIRKWKNKKYDDRPIKIMFTTIFQQAMKYNQNVRNYHQIQKRDVQESVRATKQTFRKTRDRRNGRNPSKRYCIRVELGTTKKFKKLLEKTFRIKRKRLVVVDVIRGPQDERTHWRTGTNKERFVAEVMRKFDGSSYTR